MELIKWILQLLRVDTVDFMATLSLAMVLHFGGFIWHPLNTHQPDLSSGLYICAVLLLLMRPSSRQRTLEGQSLSFWHAIWPNSLKMTLALMLLQHVALLRFWDSSVWLLDCTLYRWSGNGRLLLAVMLFSYATYRWLCQLKADADAAAIEDAAATPPLTPTGSNISLNGTRNRCPYCSAPTTNPPPAKELKDELPSLKDDRLQKLVEFAPHDNAFDEKPLTDLKP